MKYARKDNFLMLTLQLNKLFILNPVVFISAIVPAVVLVLSPDYTETA